MNSSGEIVFINTDWKDFSSKNSGDSKKTGLGVNYLSTCKDVIGGEIQNVLAAQTGIQNVINKVLPIFELEYPCYSPDEKRWFILRATPLKTDTALTLVSHINITKRWLAEQVAREKNLRIQAINERLNSTIHKIVHDIQSPLNSIEGLTSLRKLKNKKEDINTYFELISKSVVGLKGYIQETLKLSTQDSIYDSVDYKLLFEEFIRSIQYSETLKVVEIKLDVKQESDFYSDKNEIYSIVSNLISNSLKYYDPKKTKPFIAIDVTVNPAEAIVTINDNGVGIKKEELHKIFEFNFQSDKSSSAGVGIGLHMVKKSIEALNGTIDVHSIYGEGAEFIFKIPNNSTTSG
jgi:signal transduction histidine kinase